MSSSLPAFQPASELGPSSSHEEVLEALVRRQAEQLERLQDTAELGQQAGQPSPAASMKPDERQALLQIFSDLGSRVKELETLTTKQARKIEDLENVNDQLGRQVEDVKDLGKSRIEELHKEIVDIQNAQKFVNDNVNNQGEALEEVQDLINQHAEAINTIWKATKKARTPTGKKSLARIEQLKEILKTGSRTYKELERLLKISPKEMNRLVSMLDTRSYEIFFREGDGRQKVLRLRTWKASRSDSLTSNVNNFSKEDISMV